MLSLVLFWCQTLHAFEQSAEIGNIVEAALVADLLDGEVAAAQQVSGHLEATGIDGIDQRLAGLMAEEGAER